jgi:DNA-binding response OmpR family regulator
LLNQVSVLIVEDEPFIALDLAIAVEEARGKVIGPAGSVREALMLIEQHLVRAAILDINLSDRDVTPIADFLIEGGVPVIFYSGLDLPFALRERYPSACFCKKPTPPPQLLNKLVASMPRLRQDNRPRAVGREVPSEFIELSTAQMRKQFDIISAQNKELCAPAQEVATEASEPIKTGVSKAFNKAT